MKRDITELSDALDSAPRVHGLSWLVLSSRELSDGKQEDKEAQIKQTEEIKIMYAKVQKIADVVAASESRAHQGPGALKICGGVSMTSAKAPTARPKLEHVQPFLLGQPQPLFGLRRSKQNSVDQLACSLWSSPSGDGWGFRVAREPCCGLTDCRPSASRA